MEKGLRLINKWRSTYRSLMHCKGSARLVGVGFLVTALLLVSACAHSPEDSVSAAEGVQGDGRNGAPAGNSVPTNPVAVRAGQPDEAQQQAEAFWGQRTVSCGTVTYMGYANYEVNAMQGFRINLQATPISEADRLNGLQWKGITSISATASRVFLLGTAWQPWQNGMSFGAYNVIMVKQNGAWTVSPSQVSAVGNAKKLQCSDIPPDVIQPGSVWALRMQEVPVCNEFMNSYQGINLRDAQAYLDGGPSAPLNLSTCRKEDDGTTPLMRVALIAEPEVARLFLDHGAAVNAVDKQGRTALQLAEAAFNEQIRQYGPSAPPMPGGMLNPDQRLQAVVQVLKSRGAK